MSETKDCTFVTGFFDISEVDSVKIKRRDAKVYLKLFENLAVINHPLVVFIESKHKDEVDSIIKKVSPVNAKRKVISIEFNKLKWWPYLDKIKDKPMLQNKVDNRDTHLSSIMTCSKVTLVADVCRDNPFNTEYYAWIDIGIHHLHYVDLTLIDEIVKNISDKVKLALMKPTSAKEISDRDEYYRVNRGKIAATLFTGSRLELINFEKIFNNEVEKMYASKYICLEEQVFGAIICQNYDRFDFFFCDYTGILSNYTLIRKNIDCVLNSLEFCRDNGLNELGTKIGRLLIRSLQLGYIKFGHDEIAKLLYNLHICAFYSDKIYSTKIAKDIWYIYNYGNETYKAFDKYGNLEDNLSYSGVHLDDKPDISLTEFLNTDAYSYCYCIL